MLRRFAVLAGLTIGAAMLFAAPVRVAAQQDVPTPGGNSIPAIAVKCLINGTWIGCSPTAPVVATKTHVGSSVAVANTFQPVLSADATRHGCLIQNTSSSTELVFYQGGSETPTASQAFLLMAGYTFGCRASDGSPIKDAIYITSATAGATYVAQAQ